MKRWLCSKGGLLLVALGALAVLPGCRKQEPPPRPPAITTPEQPLAPWTWHKLGGLLVVVGEVDGPTDLVLKGRYLNDRMHAEFGPVRWELYAPPPNEIAELRTKEGKLLARWEFDAPVAKPPRALKPLPKAKPAPVTKKTTPPPPVPPAPSKPAAPVKPAAIVTPAVPVKPAVQVKSVAQVTPPKPPQKVKLAQSSWPETHLPLVHGPAAKVVRALKPSPMPARAAALPETHPGPPAVPQPPQNIRLAQSPWPETHLPLVHGPAAKPVLALKPSPMPARAAAALPETRAAVPVIPLPPAAPLAKVPKEPQPKTEPKPEPLPQPPLSPNLAKEWPGAGEALNLIRGPRGSHWVCMTFDGGSTAEVALEVLDALKERSIRTTFFVTGAFIQKYPDLVRRMDHDGHEIGNHTMDHPHFAPGGRRDPQWTKIRFQQQLLLADSLLLKLLGRPMDPYWRAPYGENTAELRKWAEELGYRHVYWSEGADTLDWATMKQRKLYRTGNAILDRLHSRMDRDDGDGLIVLMHLGSGRPEADRPARVLGPFLDKALDEGWNFVNISAYLKESGKPQWNSSNRLARLGQTAPRQ